jgi:pimeloyl-ACP methyl ester carboxylesterase
MPIRVANGHKFHVQHLGEGTPVVMLHGLLVGNLTTWYFTAAPELARNHEVMLYDLRGHGRSARVPSGYDVATMRDDLLALTGDFGNRPMTLVGHSYGGLVALRFALDYPERVGRLVLVEAPLPPSRMTELDEFVARTPEQMVEALPDTMRAFFARGGRQANRLLRSLHFLIMQSSLVADLRGEGDIDDAELSQLRCPVALFYGRRSSCLGVGQRLVGVLPNAELTVLPGGHYLHLECTRELTRRLVEVIDG